MHELGGGIAITVMLLCPLALATIANAIVSVLADRGVVARMYFDDLVTLSSGKEKTIKDHKMVKALLRDLGLPEAPEKAQPPAQKVRWLGIDIDASNMTLSIPPDKVSANLEVVDKYRRHRSMSSKELQSLIGLLILVAKCVPPARLFVSRLLEALRDMHGKHININSQMK